MLYNFKWRKKHVSSVEDSRRNIDGLAYLFLFRHQGLKIKLHSEVLLVDIEVSLVESFFNCRVIHKVLIEVTFHFLFNGSKLFVHPMLDVDMAP